MICWLVILGTIVAYISLIIFSEKVYKIYKFILGLFLKISNLIKIVFKLIKSIFFNLDVIFKYLIYSILTLTFLVFITNLTEFLIIFLKNFIIGLKESFSNSTREGKLYYISLYIILAYIFINKKEISQKIYKFIEDFKFKKIYSKNKENIEKYKSVILFLGVYASICLIGLKFYDLNGNDWSKANKADIINIFIWATYLITPIVAIWAFSDWKNVHNKQVEKDLSISSYNKMDEIIDLVHGISFSLRALKNERFDSIDSINLKNVEDNYILLKEKHILLISSLDLIGYLSIEIDQERISIDTLSEKYSSIFHKYMKASKALREKISKEYNLMRNYEDFIMKADLRTLQTPLYSKIEDKFDEVSSTVVGSKFVREFEALDKIYDELSIHSQFILKSIKTGIFVK